MKRWLSLFFLTLLLVSCGTPAPTTTLIPSATAIPTLSSTATPEASPTATKDPNAPQEYTRFENGIYYLDEQTETGNTLTYTWDMERNAWFQQIYEGYLWDRAKYVNDENTDWSKDELLMHIYIDSSFAGKMPFTVTHQNNTDSQTAANFNSVILMNVMTEALVDRGIIKDKLAWDMRNWVNHELYLDFTTPDGRSYRWGLWPGTTVNVHILGNYDELKADMATNGFVETRTLDFYGPANSYMLKIWADKDNNLQVEVAPRIPAPEWNEKIFLEMAFIGVGSVFEYADLTHPGSGQITGRFVLNHAALPYFTFEYP